MLLTIRKAKVIDLKKTLEWANDKEVIKNSLNRNHKVKLIELGLQVPLHPHTYVYITSTTD